MKLGYDTYSLRYHSWRMLQHLEYAYELGVDVVHASGLGEFEDLSDDHLKRVKARADELGLDIEIGMGSICPTSAYFRTGQGSATEQLRRALHVASVVGSPIVKCVLGGGQDRSSDVPLQTHIQGVIETCRAVRDQAMDMGIKIAIENHAGDLQGRELKALVEEAGPDYVGVCIDSANPMWTIENPFVTLDHLAPYVVTSHVRDVAAWEHPDGAAVQWMVMGEGTIGIDRWAERFKQECKDAVFNLESVPHRAPRVFPYLQPEFWDVYPDTPAAEFAQFLSLVKQGQPFLEPRLTLARGAVAPEEYLPALALQERDALKRGIQYSREILGIGERSL